jgi:hypothetical protein
MIAHRDSVGLRGELPVLLGHAGNHVSIVFSMMSSQELIAQAQQGQPHAIAQLINQSLKAKGIQATVNWSGGTLQVMLMLNANVSYTEAKLLSIIRRGLTALQSPRIQQVTVYAKSAAEPVPLWSRQLDLTPASPSPKPADRRYCSRSSDSTPPTAAQWQCLPGQRRTGDSDRQHYGHGVANIAIAED